MYSEWKFQVITSKCGGITQLCILIAAPEAALAGFGHDGDSYVFCVVRVSRDPTVPDVVQTPWEKKVPV